MTKQQRRERLRELREQLARMIQQRCSGASSCGASPRSSPPRSQPRSPPRSPPRTQPRPSASLLPMGRSEMLLAARLAVEVEEESGWWSRQPEWDPRPRPPSSAFGRTHSNALRSAERWNHTRYNNAALFVLSLNAAAKTTRPAAADKAVSSSLAAGLADALTLADETEKRRHKKRALPAVLQELPAELQEEFELL